MKKMFSLLGWAIALLIIYKAATWAYENYSARERASGPQEVVDIDKDCRMDADTGRCICRHKRTGEPLKVPYDECKSRALNPR